MEGGREDRGRGVVGRERERERGGGGEEKERKLLFGVQTCPFVKPISVVVGHH